MQFLQDALSALCMGSFLLALCGRQCTCANRCSTEVSAEMPDVHCPVQTEGQF